MNLKREKKKEDDKKKWTNWMVPKNRSFFNTLIASIEKITDFDFKKQRGRDKVNADLEKSLIDQDRVWANIRVFKMGKLDHKRETLLFFIDGMGMTALESEGDTLVGNFEQGKLKVTFKRKDSSQYWTEKNTDMIIDKEFNKDNDSEENEYHIRLRTAAFDLVTIRDHLCYTHLIYSNHLYQAVSKLNDKILLNLLHPHILGTREKNSDAYRNLYNDHGILLAAIGKVGNRQSLLEDLINYRGKFVNNPMTFPEWILKNQAFSGTKYVVRGKFMYDQILNYVKGYFAELKVDQSIINLDPHTDFWEVIQRMLGFTDIVFNFDNMVIWVVELIWRVTYFHYQVGNALPYLYDCDFIRWNGGAAPDNGAFWSLVVGFATSSRQYQLIKFPFDHDITLQKQFNSMRSELLNYKDEFGDEPIKDGNQSIPRWVWELEPSVAR